MDEQAGMPRQEQLSNLDEDVVSIEDKAEKYIVFKFISARQKLSKTWAGLLDNLEMI
jgi:predicted transcriptional regulator YdeE